MMRILLIVFCFCFSVLTLFGQEDLKLIRKGNSEYLNKSFDDAELSYRKALDKNLDRQETVYNLGNTLYQQERYKDAVMRYEESIKDFENDEERALAYHNLGNSLLSETLKKIDSQQPVAADSLNASINAFKEALKLNPRDADARYNLTYAQFIKSKLKKEEQEEKECNNPQESEDGEKKEEKEEKEEKEDEEKSEEEKEEPSEEEEEKEEPEEKSDEEQEEKDQGEEKEEEQEKGEEQEEQEEEEGEEEKEQQPQDQEIEEQIGEVKELSKEEAERMLEALLNEEMKVQEKIMKAKMPKKNQKIEKDW